MYIWGEFFVLESEREKRSCQHHNKKKYAENNIVSDIKARALFEVRIKVMKIFFLGSKNANFLLSNEYLKILFIFSINSRIF